MLLGPRVVLRARTAEDVPALHPMHEELEVRLRASGIAWRPLSIAESPFAPKEPNDKVIEFTIANRETDDVLGMTLLWWIDLHNRSAHIGLTLLARARGQGYGTEVVGVLCDYAFRVLGLHRLQAETLDDNLAMRGAAEANGFVLEGTSRESSWLLGTYRDDVTFGLLAQDWWAAHG